MEKLVNSFLLGEESEQVKSFSHILDQIRHSSLKNEKCSNGEKRKSFNNQMLQNLVTSLFSQSDPTNQNTLIADILLAKAMKKYLDLHFYTLRNLSKLLDEEEIPDFIISRIFSIILQVDFPSIDRFKLKISLVFDKENSNDHLDCFQASKFRTEYSFVWLKVVDKLTIASYPPLLSKLNSKILPNLKNPSLFADFLSHTFQSGGLIGILSLDSIFFLIRNENLEFPNFYKNLFDLLSIEVLDSSYRSIFFKSLNLFMSSTMVTSSTVAAIIKKLARLSLATSLSSIVWIVPFIYNMLKKHPLCRKMIHSDQQFDPNSISENLDFNSCTTNENLWEIQALENHIWKNVSGMSNIFRENFSKPYFDLDSIAEELPLIDSFKNASVELGHKWSKRPKTLEHIQEIAF